MEFDEVRTWVIFYLISFVVLLLALFFTTQGVMLGVGLTLVIVVIAINFLIVRAEIKRIHEKKEMLRKFTQKEEKVAEPEEEKYLI
ncbi:conserved hypothetical protein [Methanolacinia petrolearia DSM 11571]|uniref:Uncharacterized protein n=1 Tax=Methanolacinia petrolearia (strain DSM 11571 / OCM 486 / SEBR 4847) TaxID=679926 RepID=E1RHA7_METP4|nr:hypothetical protein [Methanolacinia petrolearia]ADN36411.1 conserved hypothetical protein [Methanolacinia petrolearia DSM 11571]